MPDSRGCRGCSSQASSGGNSLRGDAGAGMRTQLRGLLQGGDDMDAKKGEGAHAGWPAQQPSSPHNCKHTHALANMHVREAQWSRLLPAHLKPL